MTTIHVNLSEYMALYEAWQQFVRFEESEEGSFVVQEGDRAIRFVLDES